MQLSKLRELYNTKEESQDMQILKSLFRMVGKPWMECRVWQKSLIVFQMLLEDFIEKGGRMRCSLTLDEWSLEK